MSNRIKEERRTSLFFVRGKLVDPQLTSYDLFIYVPTSLGGLSRWLERVDAINLQAAKVKAFALCWIKFKTATSLELHKGGKKLASRKSTSNIWEDHAPLPRAVYLKG